jgi:hypothetical protein
MTPQEGALEEVRLQRANLLMMLVLNIPEFEGEASALPDFIQRGGTLGSHVRRELWVSADTDWAELVKRLKDQYGGARKPYVTLISTVRRREETPTQFALRIEEGDEGLRNGPLHRRRPPDYAGVGPANKGKAETRNAGEGQEDLSNHNHHG